MRVHYLHRRGKEEAHAPHRCDRARRSSSFEVQRVEAAATAQCRHVRQLTATTEVQRVEAAATAQRRHVRQLTALIEVQRVGAATFVEGLRGGSARRKDTRAHPHIQSHTGIVPAHEGGFRPHGEGGPRTHHVRRRSPMHWRPQGR